MTKNAIIKAAEEMTDDELSRFNGVYSARASQAQIAYQTISKAMGADHEATSILRESYLEVDDIRHEISGIEARRMMHSQMANISREEWSTIVD